MNDQTPIAPTKPPAPYLGGKIRLAKTLVTKINETPHTGYAEAFVGMGGVFFRRDHKPKTEVINDISGDVSNLFRILQNHYQQFMDELKWNVTSRDEFNRLVAMDAEQLTDLQRAARFIYLQKASFGGKGENFGIRPTGNALFNVNRLATDLADVHERLSGVVIECLPYEKFIPKWDREGMLFYLDPPYFGGENDYGKGIFERADYERMADLLKNIKGQFILSINDRPEIRETFAGFKMQEVSLTYSVARGRGTKAHELIITGE